MLEPSSGSPGKGEERGSFAFSPLAFTLWAHPSTLVPLSSFPGTRIQYCLVCKVYRIPMTLLECSGPSIPDWACHAPSQMDWVAMWFLGIFHVRHSCMESSDGTVWVMLIDLLICVCSISYVSVERSIWQWGSRSILYSLIVFCIYIRHQPAPFLWPSCTSFEKHELRRKSFQSHFILISSVHHQLHFIFVLETWESKLRLKSKFG